MNALSDRKTNIAQVPEKQHPKYWKHETTGRLRPVIEAYYDGRQLTAIGCALLRAYLDQWIQSPVWDLPPIEAYYRAELAKLRRSVRALKTGLDIREWLSAANRIGIEPL